jgi:hypothetical protein
MGHLLCFLLIKKKNNIDFDSEIRDFSIDPDVRYVGFINKNEEVSEVNVRKNFNLLNKDSSSLNFFLSRNGINNCDTVRFFLYNEKNKIFTFINGLCFFFNKITKIKQQLQSLCFYLK